MKKHGNRHCTYHQWTSRAIVNKYGELIWIPMLNQKLNCSLVWEKFQSDPITTDGALLRAVKIGFQTDWCNSATPVPKWLYNKIPWVLSDFCFIACYHSYKFLLRLLWAMLTVFHVLVFLYLGDSSISYASLSALPKETKYIQIVNYIMYFCWVNKTLELELERLIYDISHQIPHTCTK